MTQIEREEFTSYLFLVLGITLDQISTKIGLSNYNLLESNYITARLIDFGLWGYFDFLICTMFIAITYVSYRAFPEEKNKIVFAFPLITGVIRLLAGIMNLRLF
jgi:hypothetical protein